MLTVLMPVYNGERTLPEVLEGFCQLQSPPGGWKLVVVDNGSTDLSRSVLRSYESRLPMNYITEPRRGKSVALNTGLDHFSGDLAVFIDCDEVPRPDWLVELRKAADLHPTFSVFGGRIVPRWQAQAEPWILPYVAPTLITGPEWAEGPVVPARIYGGNMAVRAAYLEAGFRFNVTLGPKGPAYHMGEDTEFIQRICDNTGQLAWHCTTAIVEHIIRKEQMTKKWMLRRALHIGRVNYRRQMEKTPESPVLLFGFPRYLLREIIEQGLRVARCRRREENFPQRHRLFYLMGKALEGRVIHYKPGLRKT